MSRNCYYAATVSLTPGLPSATPYARHDARRCIHASEYAIAAVLCADTPRSPIGRCCHMPLAPAPRRRYAEVGAACYALSPRLLPIRFARHY